MPATGTATLLTARDLGRSQPDGSGWLFQNVDVDVAAGDRWALVGDTGAGKSLILRALALLDPVDRGEILWRGRPIDDKSVPEFRDRVLYLQQRSPVIEGTVGDNLRLPFSFRVRDGVSFPTARAARLLESFGRDTSFLAAGTTNLSGGERQILGVLRALLVEPEILLLDEPSAALDPQTTATVERLIATWYDEAPDERAYIWVSHDPEQARRVAPRELRVVDGTLEPLR